MVYLFDNKKKDEKENCDCEIHRLVRNNDTIARYIRLTQPWGDDRNHFHIVNRHKGNIYIYACVVNAAVI